MKIQIGNMWNVYNESDLFLITTNSFIKKDGALVMGAGIAKQARDRFNGLDLALGNRIEHLGVYGILISENFPKSKLGAFQVKTHFKNNADLDLVKISTERLYEICCSIHKVGTQPPKIHLNFPAIGNGKLKEEDVLPIVEVLPDYVTLWKLK